MSEWKYFPEIRNLLNVLFSVSVETIKYVKYQTNQLCTVSVTNNSILCTYKDYKPNYLQKF